MRRPTAECPSRVRELLEVLGNNCSSRSTFREVSRGRKLTLWRELVDDVRQQARKVGKEVILRHSGSARQVFHSLWPKGLVELTGAYVLIRAGADPRFDDVLESSLAELVDQFTEVHFGRVKAPSSAPVLLDQ